MGGTLAHAARRLNSGSGGIYTSLAHGYPELRHSGRVGKSEWRWGDLSLLHVPL